LDSSTSWLGDSDFQFRISEEGLAGEVHDVSNHVWISGEDLASEAGIVHGALVKEDSCLAHGELLQELQLDLLIELEGDHVLEALMNVAPWLALACTMLTPNR